MYYTLEAYAPDGSYRGKVKKQGGWAHVKQRICQFLNSTYWQGWTCKVVMDFPEHSYFSLDVRPVPDEVLLLEFQSFKNGVHKTLHLRRPLARLGSALLWVEA
jgi:hypothetical protein